MSIFDNTEVRVGMGVATGGASEASRLAYNMLGGGDGKTVSQVPLETPEQRAARQMLMRFASTGEFGNFKAGAEVPLSYGDFNMTGIEGQGQSVLQGLLRDGIPEQYKLGDAALRDMLSTAPGAMEKQFQPFSDITDRTMRESDAALRRSAGFAGNLYSTDTIRKLGDVQARGNETKTAELARLADSALNRRLQAIPLAYQSAQGQEGLAMGRVAASQNYGDLTRKLNDASIKARDTELLRRRQELQLPIAAATSVAGSSVPFGIPSVTTSPYQELLGLAAQIGGSALGNYAGGYGAAAGRAAYATPTPAAS